MKISNRQITMIPGTANSVEFNGIRARTRNAGLPEHENRNDEGFFVLKIRRKKPELGAQVKAQVKAQGTKGARTFLSAKQSEKKERGRSRPRQSLMAGWKTRSPLRETDKALKEILEEMGV